MHQLYKIGEANFTRLKTDEFFIDYSNRFEFDDITDKTARFIEEFQLLDTKLWITFVQQFAAQPDGADAGWRGEYWGKMMRGACFVYSYTKNPQLLGTLSATVRHIMTTQDKYGRISSYALGQEFTAWDIWSRKYVLLGMQYFLEINEDEQLKEEIITSMCRQVNYIISKIGPKTEDKLPITRASKHWYGLNSSSLLEPVVRLYNITGEKKYLDFAQYIADEGGCFAENIFRLAEKKQLRLYQYPVTKAYEMTSCFEGLLELYRVTKEPWYKTAILNFADLILEDDFTVIGSSGCTHELFDHSSVRQANTNNYKVMQETCVTVTLMKFFMQLNLLTGDSKYIDAFEVSYYNAYLGAVNTEKVISSHLTENYPRLKALPLPFDSYSPLTEGIRGNGIGGFKIMDGDKYYGCCVCIGAAGVGIVPKAAVLSSKDGPVINLYINGKVSAFSPMGNSTVIETKTEYPADGKVTITVKTQKEEQFILKLRNPSWSENTSVSVNGEKICVNSGYINIDRKWSGEERIELCFDMATRVIYPVSYGSQVLMNKVIWGANSVVVPTFDEQDPEAIKNIALKRGPLMLAQDTRFGYDTGIPADIKIEKGIAVVEKTEADFSTLLTVNAEKNNGEKIKLCDYGSAGKLYSEKSKVAVWIKNI